MRRRCSTSGSTAATTQEGLGWLERGLANAPAAADGLRARALHAAAFLAIARGDNQRGVTLGEESLALYRALDDREGIGRTAHMLGQALRELGDRERAVAFAEESLRLARELGHARGLIVSLREAGALAAEAGDRDHGEALLAEAERLARAHEDETGLAGIFWSRARLAIADGDVEAAARHAATYVHLYLVHGTTAGVADGVHVLARTAEAEGRPERAARLFGAAEALRETVGARFTADDAAAESEAARRARAALGDERCASARAEGRLLSLEEAVALALSDARARPVATSP